LFSNSEQTDSNSMFILVNKNTFISFLFFLRYLSAAPTSTNDNLCGKTHASILCIKDVLKDIAKSTHVIDHLTANIEESVVHKFPMLDTLYNSVNHTLHSIQLELPPSLFHDDFTLENNIDKVIQKYFYNTKKILIYILVFSSLSRNILLI